jgi:4'-phosphopantetheinyl transferase EntD
MEFPFQLDNIESFFSSSEENDHMLTERELEQSKAFGEKRLSEFRRGRRCAREALRKFGLTDIEIPIGEGRQPVWPEGFCGSISHTSGLAGAILSRKEHHLSIGLDIERRRSVDETLWDHLFTERDKTLLKALGPDPEEWATLFFSLKESFYKLQYPLTGRFLDFPEVCLAPHGDGYIALWEEGIDLPDLLRRHRMGYRFTEDHVVTYALLEYT